MTLVYVVMLLCCRTVYGYDRNDYVMATHRGSALSALSAGQTVTLEVADAAACRAYCWQHADCAAAAYSRQAGCVTFLQPPDLYDVERRNTSTLWVKEKLQLGDHLLNDTKCYQEQFLIVCKGASTIKIYHTQFLFLRACGAGDRPTAGPRPPGQETCPASGDEFEGRVDWVSARCDGLTACGGGSGDLTAKMLRYKQDSTGCPWSSSTNAEVVYYTCEEAAGRQQGGASGAAGGAVLVVCCVLALLLVVAAAGRYTYTRWFRPNQTEKDQQGKLKNPDTYNSQPSPSNFDSLLRQKVPAKKMRTRTERPRHFSEIVRPTRHSSAVDADDALADVHNDTYSMKSDVTANRHQSLPVYLVHFPSCSQDAGFYEGARPREPYASRTLPPRRLRGGVYKGPSVVYRDVPYI